MDVRSHSSIHRLEDCLRDILGLPFSATLSRSQSCIILRARQVDPYVISYVGRLSSSRRFDIASPWLSSLLARFRFLPLALGAGGPRPPVNIPPPGFGSCSILSHAVPGAASLPRLRPRCPGPHWIVSLFAAIRVFGISHPICCRSLPSLSLMCSSCVWGIDRRAPFRCWGAPEISRSQLSALSQPPASRDVSRVWTSGPALFLPGLQPGFATWPIPGFSRVVLLGVVRFEVWSSVFTL